MEWWLNPTIQNTIVGEVMVQLKRTHPTICVFHKRFMHAQSWSWGYVWNLHQACSAWSLEGYCGTNPCRVDIQVPNAWYQHTLLIMASKNLCDMSHNCKFRFDVDAWRVAQDEENKSLETQINTIFLIVYLHLYQNSSCLQQQPLKVGAKRKRHVSHIIKWKFYLQQ